VGVALLEGDYSIGILYLLIIVVKHLMFNSLSLSFVFIIPLYLINYKSFLNSLLLPD